MLDNEMRSMLLYTLLNKYADVKLAVEAMPITDNLFSSITCGCGGTC